MFTLIREGLRFVAVVLIIVLIVVALFTGLLRVGLPYVSAYRAQFQSLVTDYLGTPVEIGSLELAWGGLSPRVTLQNVALLENATTTNNNPNSNNQRTDNQSGGAPVSVPMINLDQIHLDLNIIKSITKDGWHVNEITIVGADLEIEYFGDREFKVRGYQLPASRQRTKAEAAAPKKNNDSSLDVLAWLMNARRVGLQDSRIKLIDQRRRIDYVIEGININAENNDDLHQLRVDLALPSQLGRRLEIGVDMIGDVDNLTASKGNFYANVEAMRLHDWLNIWPQRQVNMSGQADAEFWGKWADNQLVDLRGRLGAESVTLSSTKTLFQNPEHPLASFYESLSADLSWRRNTAGWVAEIDRFDFVHRGRANQIKNASVTQANENDQRNVHIHAEGERLQLSAIAGLISTLDGVPSLETVATYAHATSANGELLDWRADSVLTGTSLMVESLEAVVDDVTMRPFRQVPGVQNLSGRVAVSDNVGRVTLDSSDLQVSLPTLFEEPLVFDQVVGDVNFDGTGGERLVHAEQLVVRDDALYASTRFAVDRVDGDIQLDMQSNFKLDSLPELARYLPAKKMRPRLKRWLTVAPKAGKISKGDLLLFGKLRDFPFVDRQGVFKLNMDVDDADIQFRTDWPTVTAVNGTIQLDGPSITFQADEGTMAGATLDRAEGYIENFRKPYLKLMASNRGALNDYLAFANNGPLKRILSPAFNNTTARGNATMQLEMAVPLRPKEFRDANEIFAVDGSMSVADTDWRFNQLDINLDAVSGTVDFTEKSFAIDQMRGAFLGSSIKVNASTDPKTRESKMTFTGNLHADRVFSKFAIPLNPFFDGPSPMQLQLGIPASVPGQPYPGVKLTASSQLTGTAVTLPAPLAKKNGLSQSTVVSTVLVANQPRHWKIRYGRHSAYAIAGSNGLSTLSVHLDGVARREPIDGIVLRGSLASLPGKEWVDGINLLIDTINESATPSGRKPLPIMAQVETRALTVGEKVLGRAVVNVSSDDASVTANIENKNLRGTIRFPRDNAPEPTVYATVDYAAQPLIDALRALGDDTNKNLRRSSADDTVDPRTYPPLQVRVKTLALSDATLRDLLLRTQPSLLGMTIETLGFANEHGQLIGKGLWHVRDAQQVNPELGLAQLTSLDLRLQSGNLGKTLAAFDIDEAVANGRGAITANLSWDGPLYKPDVSTLDGDITLDVEDGSLLGIEPGAARIVGLFALQELPRRLLLDFRDITNQGLDFRTITGNITVAGGVLDSQPLRLEGPIGVIELTGVADLNSRTLDQRLRVLPRVTAALPIIGILTGGASAGVGALLATPILKALGIDFDKIGLKEYALSGGFDDPQFKKLALPTELMDFEDRQ